VSEVSFYMEDLNSYENCSGLPDRARKLCSKIIDCIWGNHPSGTKENLCSVMSRLRTRIGLQNQILSVHGVGYALLLPEQHQ